jgi:NifU-like protein involved in Fe-S cluster formation
LRRVNYNALTLQYFEADAAAGELCGPDVFRGAAGSRSQGTWVQFDLEFRSGAVERALFLAFGCPHTIAAAAWVAEHAVGPASRAALPETVQQLSDRFAVPVEKRGRLLIVEDAWLAALTAALQRLDP